MNVQSTRRFGLFASSAFAAASLMACGGGNDAPATEVAPTSTLAAAITSDAPTCGLDAINVTINKLRFHTDANAAPEAAGWTELAVSPARKINLLNLANANSGTTTALGEVTLPAGVYTQMRLVLDTNAGNIGNTVVATGSTAEVPLDTSAAASGIKVALSNEVEVGRKTNIVFSFAACESVQKRGAAYVLVPAARQLPTALNGIRGFIDPATLNNKVLVRAQLVGATVATTAPNPTTGEFVLPRLEAGIGTYTVVITGDDKTSVVVGAVPVTATELTAVSTTTAPIKLVASATSTISGKVTYTAPAVAPANGTVVSAIQFISANATVGNPAITITHAYQYTDAATGAYSLTKLPRSGLQFAFYKGTLPLSFAAATTSPAAGRYRIEAKATGFLAKTTTASASVNASTGNVTGIDIPLP